MIQNKNQKLVEILKNFKNEKGKIVVMTGAGISAESGIPTFRGEDGYWKIGSKNYTPETIATFETFQIAPLSVWKWYFQRMSMCKNAKPNEAHDSLVLLENFFEERFGLITQNIDGLHFQAGSSREKTFTIHGTFEKMRCMDLCSPEMYPIPSIELEQEFTKQVIKELTCPNCGKFLRPNILWFDEFYNEVFYKSDSAISLVQEAKLFIVVGTSGATNLPSILARMALEQGSLLLNIDIEENFFSRMFLNTPNGYFLKGKSSKILPKLVDILVK
jgi:NAD-dependent deacetylase